MLAGWCGASAGWEGWEAMEQRARSCVFLAVYRALQRPWVAPSSFHLVTEALDVDSSAALLVATSVTDWSLAWMGMRSPRVSGGSCSILMLRGRCVTYWGQGLLLWLLRLCLLLHPAMGMGCVTSGWGETRGARGRQGSPHACFVCFSASARRWGGTYSDLLLRVSQHLSKGIPISPKEFGFLFKDGTSVISYLSCYGVVAI